VKVAPEIIASLCRAHAGELFTPANWQGTPFDKVRLLWGISGVESTFGMNCNPRHETGYCLGGRYFDRERTLQWGCLAHCSYGPWQVMFQNFPFAVSPLSLMWADDGLQAAQFCLRGAVGVLNRAIGRGVRNLSDLVIAYNGPANEEEYSGRLVEAMDRPIPEVIATASKVDT
jgi:hypothetical protein